MAEGNVIRTDPKAGVAVAEGDEITVYVSSGKETVVVPTLVGLSLTQAKEALAGVGLQLGTVIQRNDKSLQADTVMEASEKADAEVAPDTVVNLVVASGRVTLTDLTGWTVDAATRQLEQIGLAAQPTELTDCPATDPATVVSMSAAPGDIAIGSTVELRFCAAPAQ